MADFGSRDYGIEPTESKIFMVEYSVGDEGKNINTADKFWTPVKAFSTILLAELFVREEFAKYQGRLYFRIVTTITRTKYFS